MSPPLEGSAVVSPPTAPAPPVPSGTQGGAKTPLPSVHADAQDYYGGEHVQTRARTYSAVSPLDPCQCMKAHDRMVSWVILLVGHSRWMVNLSRETGGCRMVSHLTWT